MEGLVKFTIKGKLAPEESKDMFQQLKNRLEAHVGKYVILKEKDGRSYNMYLLEVLPNLLGRYKNYDVTGEFIGYTHKRIDPVLVFIGEDNLVFLQEKGGSL